MFITVSLIKLGSVFCFTAEWREQTKNNFDSTIQTNPPTIIFRCKDEISFPQFILLYFIVFLIRSYIHTEDGYICIDETSASFYT